MSEDRKQPSRAELAARHRQNTVVIKSTLPPMVQPASTFHDNGVRQAPAKSSTKWNGTLKDL